MYPGYYVEKYNEIVNRCYNLENNLLRYTFNHYGIQYFYTIVQNLKHNIFFWFLDERLDINWFKSLSQKDKQILLDTFNFYKD